MERSTKSAVLAAALLAAAPAAADLARVGPTDAPSPPGNGFPRWYQDLSGLVLDACLPDASDPGALQQTACLLGPPNPPYVFPTNFPDELFYFRAVSNPVDTGGGKRAILTLALEGAFATPAVAPGQQVVFTRIRVFAGVPFDGTYTVTHPYGIEVFPDVVAGAGNRDIVFSEDVGITAPGFFTEALRSRVGPFLQAAAAPGGPPLAPVTLNGAQFLSDGVAPVMVTGSPFGTDWFEICGPFDGPGLPDRCIRQLLFTLTGRVHDTVASPIASPLAVDRATYGRDDAGGTRIDVAASALPGIGKATPRLSAGAVEVAPVLMSGPTALGRYYAQGLAAPAGIVPQIVTVTNSADVPPSSVTAHLLDEVTVLSAVYAPGGGGALTVVATSSDKGFTATGATPPALALEGFAGVAGAALNPADAAERTFTVSPLTVPPAAVTVQSAAGGHGSMDVFMGAAVASFPPGAPLAVDDRATAVQGGPGVVVAVLANDVVNPAASATGLPAVLAPGPTGGAAAVNADGTITYTPPPTTGTFTFAYTVANAVGASNVATVTVDVVPGAGGPVPTANADPSAGAPALVVTTGASIVIDVLANDTGNGGTVDPASVRVVTAPASGTATPNPATGSITYTAGAAAGTVTFAYTVANTNGQVSPPATVTVTVATPEGITITRARCQRASNTWDVRGTSTVSTSNTITLFNVATVPATPGANVLGSAPVAAGVWQFQQRSGLPCTSPISLRSSLGTKVQNISVQLQ